MKVLILDPNIGSLNLPSKLAEPLNLYGFVRKREELCYIFSIGKKNVFLPLIGQITENGSVPAGLRLMGMFQEGKLKFFYRQKNGWQIAEHQISDLADAFARTPFPEKLLAKLKNSHIALIGLGSVGSSLALGLVRCGVGNFNLADPDILTIENISRHVCDLYDLGRSKVIAVKERMRRINPTANVKTYACDIFQTYDSLLEDFFKNVDLVIATTDRNAVQLRVNDECYGRKIPALFAGCYEEARGGEVLFVLPGATPICLECLRGGVRQPERRGPIDYSNAQGPEDYKGEPGLNAAINLVTDVAQQYAVALLLRNEECEMAKLIDPKRNLQLIGGALGESYYLFKKPFHFINPVLKGPWKECGTCQGRNGASMISGTTQGNELQKK
jgi:molybdopterin/thiamine biosynthesis adenylyltransferase